MRVDQKICECCDLEAEHFVCHNHKINSVEKEVLEAGFLLIDHWTQATQGLEQCVKCGIRTLSPAETNKVPEGWMAVPDSRELPARWNIWIGICPACQQKVTE